MPRFSPAARALLLTPARWRLVGTALPPDVRPLRSPRHACWAQRHRHAHAHRELLFVLGGNGIQSVGGEFYPERPGTVFLFDAMEEHALNYPPGHAAAEHLWLLFVQDRVLAVCRRIGIGRRASGEVWRRWFTLGELGLASGDLLFPGPVAPGAPTETGLARVRAGVALLAASLAAWAERPPAAERPGRDDLMAMIRRHIREADGKGCRLDTLARLAGYGKFHFLRLFKAQAGVTPHRYAERCRREAYERLAAKGYSQKAIAEALGFAHPSALSRWRSHF